MGLAPLFLEKPTCTNLLTASPRTIPTSVQRAILGTCHGFRVVQAEVQQLPLLLAFAMGALERIPAVRFAFRQRFAGLSDSSQTIGEFRQMASCLCRSNWIMWGRFRGLPRMPLCYSVV